MGSESVILLDTHIWIWWVHGDPKLPKMLARQIERFERNNGLGVSVISCWEVAKLVEYGKLELPCPIQEWLDSALNYPGISLIELTPEIAVESTQLPGKFHRDPADQIIVATARVLGCALVTVDSRILDYCHVKTANKPV